MLLFPIIGVLVNGFPIGWASTPFDPRWEERYPRRAAWMSAAGPAANLALALAALAFLRAGLAAGFFVPPETLRPARFVAGHVAWIDGMGRFTSMMLFLNTILCLFNLIPFPPLDGASASHCSCRSEPVCACARRCAVRASRWSDCSSCGSASGAWCRRSSAC